MASRARYPDPITSRPRCQRRRAASHRRARAARLANTTTPLRTVGAVRLAAHRGPRRARPRRHAVRHRRLGDDGDVARQRAARGWSEDHVDRPEGRRVRAHRLGVRTCRRVRHHPQRLRLPPADVHGTGRHTGRDDDPRILVAAHRRRSTSATTPPPATWRSATPTATPGCTTPPPCTTGSTPVRSASTRRSR